MKILIFNSRISSVEFDIWEMPSEKLIVSGQIDKIGSDSSVLTLINTDGQKSREIKKTPDYESVMEHIVQILNDCGLKMNDISAIGHRVVYGGIFSETVIIDEAIKKEIYKDADIAPLHNPYNLKLIEAAQKKFPDIKHIAVFDTAFHMTMPEVCYRYPVPERLYHEYKIRRFGFHGLFHKHLLEKTAKQLKKDVDRLNILTCYLGAGCSITAIKNGKSFDTSMGFTPLEGLMMTTRSGDIPAGMVLYLAKHGWQIKDLERMFMYESGLLGISGETDDIQKIIELANRGNKKCQLAIEMFVHSIRKYIGAYWIQMPDLEAISLGGSIAEESPLIRKKIFENLETFGIGLSNTKNEDCISRDGEISEDNSKIKIFVFSGSVGRLLLARETFRAAEQKLEAREER